MERIVQQFLESKKAEERAEYEEEKRKILRDLGLVHKEYSDNDEYTEGFPNSEYDQAKGRVVWYRITGIDVSDEEYEEIRKYTNCDEKEYIRNYIASVLQVIAWVIYVGGFFLGIKMGNEMSTFTSEFAFSVAIVYWCVALVSGTIFLGFAEIIKLLEAIKRKK